MTDEDLPDCNLYGLEELLDDLYGLPDIHIDELAALLEIPGRIAQITSIWPW
ncbi:MAG: hypothetical protein WBJ41_13315 [Chromatiaceae bacterium]